MKRLPSTLVLVLLAALGASAAGCGGNYSNTDLEFQLALPDPEDLSAKVPVQSALTDADAARFYVATRKVARDFNGVVNALTGLIDAIRAHPPSARGDDQRVWGPFPYDKAPRFELRLVMTRAAGSDAANFGRRLEYDLQMHLKGDRQAPWISLLSGAFSPAGSVRQGRGELRLQLGPARAAGLPPSEFEELDSLSISYQTGSYPLSVEMRIQGRRNPGITTYSYNELPDGAGGLRFVWHEDSIWAQTIEVQSRWLGSGAGRADWRVLEGLAALSDPRGSECWGPDGRATYVRRDFAPPRENNKGDPSACLLPAPGEASTP